MIGNLYREQLFPGRRQGEKVRFALDSLLEQRRFELSVPP